MNKEVIFSIIYCLVTVGAFCAGKFIFPKIPASVKENLADLAEWAAKFVVWAREFLKTESGEKKMAAVVEQLKQIAEKAGIEVTEEQLKAIAQTAYEAMKAGEAEAQPGQLLEAAAITPGATVVINTGAAAVATDKVPDGALQKNPDGTVNAYDADGNKVGTVSAEAAEEAARNVGVIITEGNG
nr:phage holin, LLH family [uncultured Acetatifactor sp.]